MTAEIAYMGQQRPYVSEILSLGNALLHFGVIEEPWDQHSQEFEGLVDDAGARSGPAAEEKLDAIAERYMEWPRWPRLGVEKYTALEMSKELVTKLLDKGAVVAIPVWAPGPGLHSILIVGHTDGQYFAAVNRVPFRRGFVKDIYDWEDLGFRRWNVPVRVYTRKE